MLMNPLGLTTYFSYFHLSSIPDLETHNEWLMFKDAVASWFHHHFELLVGIEMFHDILLGKEVLM